MRSRPYVLALSALFLNTAALGQEMSPKPEPREGVPNDKCVIELNLPNQATVRIDDRDYGEQRSITLPIPKPPLNRDGFGRPCFFLSVGFSNDGRRSMTVEVKGGTVVRVALSAPPIEPVLLEGPSDDITSLAFSPDGKWIATGTYDQQAILWETSTGWIRWNGDVPWCNAAESSVSVAFSPDGAQLLVAHECTGVAILDAATGKRLRDLSQALNEDGPGGANAVALTRDGRMVVAALSWRVKPLAVIWDRKSGRRLKILTGPKRPADQSVHDFRSIAVTPDSRYVVAALDEATVVLDISTGKMLRTFPSNSGSVLSVAISPDGTKLLTGTTDTKAVLWDLKSGKQLQAFHCATDESNDQVSSVAFSPDGRQALAGGGERAFLFDVGTGTMVRSFDAGDRGETISAFSPDGRYILTAGSRNSLSLHEAVLWEAATGKRVQSFRGPTDAIRSLAFNDDGQQLKVDYELGWTATWDLSDGKPVHEMGQAVVDQEQDRSETWPNEYTSADGRWKVSRAKDNDVVLIDMHSSKTTTILHYPSYKPIKAAFSAKSPRVAVADGYSVHVFNPETGKELATLISAYGGRDWLVTTPSNYFDGSRGGQSLIRWRVGEAVYPFGHLEKQLHRPDLVAKTLQEKQAR